MQQLSIELARRLLAEVSALSGGPFRIPVKVHPSASKAGRDRHWRRGNLVDTTTNAFIVRPINDHGKDEEAPIGSVKLWRTRMAPQIMSIVDRLYSEWTNEMQLKKTSQHLLAAAVDHALGSPVIPTEVAGFALDMGETDLQPERTVEAETVEQPVMVPASNAKQAFRQKLEDLKRLKQAIASDGVQQLRNLFDDLSEARKFVEMIEGEIQEISVDLADFDVVIPPELVLGAETKTKHGSGSGNSWPKRAKELRPQIDEYLKSIGNDWTKGAKIMAAIQAQIESPSTVLMPLVADGVLERRGEKNAVEYRLKQYAVPAVPGEHRRVSVFETALDHK